MKVEDLNVTILAYTRPKTFKRVFESCMQNINKVNVIIDKPANTKISLKQEQILDIIKNSKADCRVIRRSTNYGLVKSVLTAVDEGLQSHDHIVLLEDDCLPNLNFFEFMAKSLEEHKNNLSISTVCGTKTSCRFNPWGWATWKHKWDYKNFSLQDILNSPSLDIQLKNFLQNNAVEESIWSLNWLAYQYINGCSSVFPKHNLIKNIGLDDGGVHDHKKGYTQWLLSQIIQD